MTPMDSTVEFESILTFLDHNLQLFGFQVFDGLWDQKQRRLFRSLNVIIFAMQPMLSMLFILEHFSSITIKEFSDCAVILFATSQSVLKMLFILNRHEYVKILIQTSREFRATYSQNEDFSDLIYGYTKRFKWLLRTIHCCYFIAIAIQVILPLVTERYNGLPFNSNFPFLSLDHTGIYLLNYAYQIYIAFGILIFAIGVEGLFMLSISEACMQMDVLKEKLKMLGVKNTNNTLEPNYLGSCHDLHVTCLSYLNEVQQLFANLSMSQIGISCMTICMLMYILTGNYQEDSPKTYTGLIAVMVQLFIYCGCGQILTDKVHGLTTAIITNEWYNLSLEEQKSLVIIMSRSQDEVYLSAAGFNLSLKNFISVIKTAYSYSAVMLKIDS